MALLYRLESYAWQKPPDAERSPRARLVYREFLVPADVVNRRGRVERFNA